MALSDPYEFEAELWEWGGKASWCFASLPEPVADEIDGRFGHLAAGFGSFKVEVAIGATTWRTSVFPDAKRGTLILPVKKDVRRREGVDYGDTVTVALRVVVD